MKINLGNTSDFYVKIDNGPWESYKKVGGTVDLTPTALSEGTHMLCVAQGKDYDYKFNFQGLLIDDGASIKELSAEECIIEYIGDSITCGYTNDQANVSDYAWVCSELLGCEHTQMAYPGINLTSGYSDTGMDSQYFKLQSFAHSLSPDWNFTDYTPKIVVINLGQNDFANNVPDAVFQDTYITFLSNIRAKLPDAEIFVLRTFLGWKATPTQAAVNVRNVDGDLKVHYVNTEGWLTANSSDYNDGVHPSESGHVKVANSLKTILAPYVNTAASSDTNLDSYDVSWDTPGSSSAESMPLGNGDIGLNVWTESNGDINFYISKTDAWSENNYSNAGALLKLGRVRISMNPRPSVEPFTQVLKLRQGEIRVIVGNTTSRIWVDANNPVIHVEANSDQEAKMSVELINWRTEERDGISADVIRDDQPNRIVWYHRNSSSADPHLANWTIGAAIKGTGMTSSDRTHLADSDPTASHLVSIYPLTTESGSTDSWLSQVNSTISEIEEKDFESMRTEHQNWWDSFWNRSWIYVTGNESANTTTQGYILQRFITACAGRGAYPIKFNGSIFTVDNPTLTPVGSSSEISVDSDYRTWGGQYWFQNTRAMYWPRLAAGDFEMMLPLFNMYKNMLEDNAAQVNAYYGHEGAYFAETKPFWGGLAYAGPELKEDWTLHYFTPIMELSMMMLDYYEYTQDEDFAVQTLLPVASAGITFFDKHFPRDGEGNLSINPANAIEMYWKVNNNAPDIAGLKAVLTRMIALPDIIVSSSTKEEWNNLLEIIPPLPTGLRNNKTILLPYEGPQTAQIRNGENPELYPVYPFRLYGLTKDDLELAKTTFSNRLMYQKGCWVQDPVQAAMLGFANTARDYVSFNLTRKDPRQKFPAFWAQGNDYSPDQDNGGNGEMGLQQMIMYTDSNKIVLNAAWPSDWNCDFKLNAPFQTTVQGSIIDGEVTNLVVTPASRAKDIIIQGLTSDGPIGSVIYLIGNNNMYVSSKKGESPIICNVGTPGNSEKFVLVDAGNGTVALRGNNQKYVTNTSPMWCNGESINDYTRFYLEELGNGLIALKSLGNNKYVCSENGGSSMNCNRDGIGEWERFNIEKTSPTASVHNFVEPEMSVIPNPANNYITVQAPMEEYSLAVLSITGKTCLSRSGLTATNTIDTSELKGGVYFVKVDAINRHLTKKIVIQ